MIDAPLLADDEHEVPTQLGERVPFLRLPFPFDLTQREFYLFVMCMWYGSLDPTNSLGTPLPAWLVWALIGVAGTALDRFINPNAEYWLSAWCEYLLVLVVSFPLWWKRLIPFYRHGGQDWPLAVVPHWLGRRLVQHVEILPDGILRLPGRPGRPPKFAVVLKIPPQPHPDLLPELLRQARIQTRLNIFKRIRGDWSLHLQVRPFDAMLLEIASGPSWEWVKTHMAPRMVQRSPWLAIHGDDSETLALHAASIVHHYNQAGVAARRQTVDEARRLRADLWGDTGVNQRVRVGLRRVMAGRVRYCSWAIVLLPRIIHLSWLRPLACETLLCDLAVHVRRRPLGATRRSLQRRIRQWRAVDTDEDYALAEYDARRTVRAMQRTSDTEATIGMYVTARQEQAEAVVEALETAQCDFKSAFVMQHRALRATRVMGGDPYRRTMPLDLRTVATTDLESTSGYFPENGILVGEGLSAPEPIAIDLLDDEVNFNWAMFIAIMQGGGKTTLAELIAWRMANPHPRHRLAQIRPLIVSVDFKSSGDYGQLYANLKKRGHRASYNSWTSGALPPLDHHMGFNLADVPEKERGPKLLELTERIEEWAAAHTTSEQPLVFILDEVLALIETRGGPSFMRNYGTQGRSKNIAPIFCTQDIEPVVANQRASLALKNCGHIFLGRQNPAGINALVPLLSLDPTAELLLASAPQGGGLLRIERKVGGPVVLGVQVRASDWELFEFGTNPRERVARWRAEQAKAHNGLSHNGKEEYHNGLVQLGTGAGPWRADDRAPNV
jgi:hypothetical protein